MNKHEGIQLANNYLVAQACAGLCVPASQFQTSLSVPGYRTAVVTGGQLMSIDIPLIEGGYRWSTSCDSVPFSFVSTSVGYQPLGGSLAELIMGAFLVTVDTNSDDSFAGGLISIALSELKQHFEPIYSGRGLSVWGCARTTHIIVPVLGSGALPRDFRTGIFRTTGTTPSRLLVNTSNFPTSTTVAVRSLEISKE